MKSVLKPPAFLSKAVDVWGPDNPIAGSPESSVMQLVGIDEQHIGPPLGAYQAPGDGTGGRSQCRSSRKFAHQIG